MRFSTLLTSVSSLLLATLALAEGSSDVIDLTPANFNSVVSPEKLILVEFFAPWYTVLLFLFFTEISPVPKVWTLQSARSSLRGGGHCA
jgi:hypothetical protein